MTETELLHLLEVCKKGELVVSDDKSLEMAFAVLKHGCGFIVDPGTRASDGSTGVMLGDKIYTSSYMRIMLKAIMTIVGSGIIEKTAEMLRREVDEIKNPGIRTVIHFDKNEK